MEEDMKSFTLVLVMLIGLISLNADNYSVNFDINDLSTTINAMKFHEFKLADCSATREIGHPKLPCKVVSYIIPVNMKVSNLSISENSILLKGTFNVMPVQTPEFENGENVDFTPPDSTIYAHNMIYPYSSAQIVSHSYMDGANNIVSIALFPLRYNPVTGVVTFANNISISFNYVPSSEQPLYPTKRFAIDTPKYDAYLYNLVENPNDIATHRNLSNIEIDPSEPKISTT